MFNKKKFFSVVTSAVLATALITGCGTSDTAGSESGAVKSASGRSALIFQLMIADDAKGDVTVTRDGSPVEGYEGMRLTAGDTVTTDDSTAAYLRIDDDKNLRLSNCSSVSVNEASANNINIKLESGELYANIENKLDDDETMEFEAGGTTMSIRGTSLDIGYDETEGLSLIVTDGHVAVAPTGSEDAAETMVNGGQMVTLATDEQASPSNLAVENYDITDLPENIMMELKNNDALYERVVNSIAETQGKDVKELETSLDKRLETVDVKNFNFDEKITESVKTISQEIAKEKAAETVEEQKPVVKKSDAVAPTAQTNVPSQPQTPTEPTKTTVEATTEPKDPTEEIERRAEETRKKLEAEQAAKRAEAERIAAEKAAEEQARLEREAAAKAEAERLAAEQQAEAERLAAEQAEAERLAAEQAEAERLAAEQQAEAERLAAEQQAEADRLAAEQAQREEQARLEREAAEQAAADKRAADTAAANAVTGKINEIGEVTLDSAEKIEAARNAYAALTDDQKALVTNYSVVTTAETTYNQLVADKLARENKAREDRAAADLVTGKINAIGEVTLESGDKITEAKDAYAALTDDQKALVTNYDVVTTAETTYNHLVAQKAAEDAKTFNDNAILSAPFAATSNQDNAVLTISWNRFSYVNADNVEVRAKKYYVCVKNQAGEFTQWGSELDPGKNATFTLTYAQNEQYVIDKKVTYKVCAVAEDGTVIKSTDVYTVDIVVEEQTSENEVETVTVLENEQEATVTISDIWYSWGFVHGTGSDGHQWVRNWFRNNWKHAN